MRASQKTFRFEIFVISLAAILFEISLTRLFSFKLYYYFTYLILGIAMLGLGAGGVLVAISPRLRGYDPVRLVSACCMGGGALVPLAYLVIALVQISVVGLATSPVAMAKLFVIAISLFSPFLLVGVILATIFGNRPSDMNRLYFWDLAGAGLGCGLAVLLFVTITPPGAAIFAGTLLAGAGVACARGLDRGLTLGSGGIAGITLMWILVPGAVPDPTPDPIKTMSPQNLVGSEVLFSGWSSVFRVDVVAPSFGSGFLTLHHDGNIGSALHEFDGDFEGLARFDQDKRSKPFQVLPEGPRVLIIGVAGGQEVLTSLYFGAREVVGVDLNPVTTSLLTDHFADYTGRIGLHPRVQIINAEGRSFLERNDEKFDLIWMVAPDSYAAMNASSSGAFVLSESYLYTVEMVQEALGHLTDGGIVCAQFGELHLNSTPNRTPRFVATAREAFRRHGVTDFGRHILVSAGPGFLPASTILLSRDPFTGEQVRSYQRKVAALPKTRMWFPTPPGQRFENPVTEIITRSERELSAFFDEYVFDVTPVTDDSPFFWHFTPFTAAISGGFTKHANTPDFEVATGERMLMVLLVFASGFASIFILLPTLAIREVWSQIPYKVNVGLYFASLGLGFMFFEVCLIQKLTLFLGYPSYSLTVTLFSLLIFSGIGSLVSDRYSRDRNRAFLYLLGGLVALTLALQFFFPLVTRLFITASLGLRIAVTIVCLAPVGLILGAFMPIGVATTSALSPFEKQYVAWAWAVNGFCSVVASVLATILSMTFGFQVVFVTALVIYALGIAALSRIPEPARAMPRA